MCHYIKDDGEQCGRETKPFCHQHEDSAQSKMHEIGEQMFGGGDVPTGGQFAQLIGEAVDTYEVDSESREGGQNRFDPEVSGRHCDGCESAVRRTERLSEHPNLSNNLMAEAVLECDCSEVVLGTQPIRKTEAPDGWSE